MSVSIRGIAKKFGRFPALHGIDLEIGEGELITLLGPSGSGKTTLLRILAGLEIPDSGSLYFDENEVTDATPEKRRVGLVFQHYALWGHLSVFENVAFGLRVGKRRREHTKAEVAKRVNQLIHMVQLEGMERRLPSQLSGGQQQRVGLARALAIEPRVLLLDEPFGALDAKVRKELRHWVRSLQKELGITTVFVTHDQEEALEMSDRIAVMNLGNIEQVGSPAEIYNSPQCAFVCEFVGNTNKFPVRVVDSRVWLGDRVIAEVPISNSGEAFAYVRPGDLELSEEEAPLAFPVGLRTVLDVGAMLKAWVEEPVTRARLEIHLNGLQPAGDRWWLRAKRVHVF